MCRHLIALVPTTADRVQGLRPRARPGTGMGCIQSKDAAPGGGAGPARVPEKQSPAAPVADKPSQPTAAASLQPPAAVTLGEISLEEKPGAVTMNGELNGFHGAAEKVASSEQPSALQSSASDVPPQPMCQGMRRTASATAPLDIASCGVSLRFIRRFFREVATTKPDISSREVVEMFIKPATQQGEVRYSSLVPPEDIWSPGKGNMYLIVHAWDTQFSTLVNRLNERFHKEADSKVFIWIDLFAVNPWNPVECASLPSLATH